MKNGEPWFSGDTIDEKSIRPRHPYTPPANSAAAGYAVALGPQVLEFADRLL